MRYSEIFEAASGGSTGAGAIASVASPIGSILKRPSIFGSIVPAVPKKKKKKKKAKEAVKEGEDSLELDDIEVGDEIKVGRFLNSKATVKGFKKDKHNQPILKTTKGDRKLFKPRLSKLEELDEKSVTIDEKKTNQLIPFHKKLIDLLSSFSMEKSLEKMDWKPSGSHQLGEIWKKHGKEIILSEAPEEFVTYAQKRNKNPHLPNLYGPFTSADDDYLVSTKVFVEQLEPLPKIRYGKELGLLMAILDKVSQGKFDTIEDRKSLMIAYSGVRGRKFTVGILRKYERLIKTFSELDIAPKPKNFMVRASDSSIVIVGPLNATS